MKGKNRRLVGHANQFGRVSLAVEVSGKRLRKVLLRFFWRECFVIIAATAAEKKQASRLATANDVVVVDFVGP